ncbi:MAG: hypothetical protein ACR2PL_23200 [Dehalococcoidia bacterium]
MFWFEHDLYNQLQLLQVLDWFSGQNLGETTLSLIRIGSFPGIARFGGLGRLTPAQLASLFQERRPLTDRALSLGQRAWAAVRSPDPLAVEQVIEEDTSALPYLAPALVRHLERFPGLDDGLGRTERQILQALDAGSRNPAEVFVHAAQESDDPLFMADLPFWTYLAQLARSAVPLVRRDDGGRFFLPHEVQDQQEFHGQRLILTDVVDAVLQGDAGFVSLNGIDRWYGGVHLQGKEHDGAGIGGNSSLSSAPIDDSLKFCPSCGAALAPTAGSAVAVARHRASSEAAEPEPEPWLGQRGCRRHPSF